MTQQMSGDFEVVGKMLQRVGTEDDVVLFAHLVESALFECGKLTVALVRNR